MLALPLAGYLIANRGLFCVLFAAAGWMPFLTHLLTGYAIDGRWVAGHDRIRHPARFKIALVLSVAAGFFFSFAAYSLYQGAE
ncbi:hypothetical protein [Arenimonas sp.]|uniref:hypothetical protein n=1 Tax=Arenimonas sp. TaxID=1872635 RepID=UPI0039E3B80B